MPKLLFNDFQGSPSVSYGCRAGSASGNKTPGHEPDQTMQPGPSNKRKAPQAEDGGPRASKKVKTLNDVETSTTTSGPSESIRRKVSQAVTDLMANLLSKRIGRPRLWDNRPGCSSDDATGLLLASQQRDIRTAIAASSAKRKTRKTKVHRSQAPQQAEIPKEPMISTAQLEAEGVKRVFGEQVAASANNTDNPVPNETFRKWRDSEVKFKMMTQSTEGGGVNGLSKSRNGNIIRPPKQPVPLFQKPDTNKGCGTALTSTQIRQVMQCRARAPSEYKLYKPRYSVSKNLCPGQDPRTLPMNLLNRLRDSEPESVSLSEVAMMKEIIRPNVDKIKKRRARRAARAAKAQSNKAKALALTTEVDTGELGGWPRIPASTERTLAYSAVGSSGYTPDSNGGTSEPIGSDRQCDVPQAYKIYVDLLNHMTLEEMQQEYRRIKSHAPPVWRKRDENADREVDAPKGKRPQRDASSA